jgi:predicted DNA-binding transcriptional regulator AlpA
MLTTVNEAAERLKVHRSTIYRLVKDDPTFPELLYIRPRCPRLNVAALDSWASRQKLATDYMYVSPDLYTGKARGSKKKRMAAAR